VTFDEAVPIAIDFSPADNETGVSTDINLMVTFDEYVQAGVGDIIIKKSTDDAVVATTADGTLQVSFSDDTVTIDSTVDLPDSTRYDILIDAGAITDLAGNPYAGISEESIWNFMTIFGENGGNIITLESGWNVFSTPRQLNSIEFSNGGIGITFSKLEGGAYSGNTTPATIANIKPLEGFLVNNTSGDVVYVYLDYKKGLTSGQRLFTKVLDAGWNIVGVADQSFSANDVDYTEIELRSALDSITGQFANIIDYTGDFGDDDDNQVDSFTQIFSTQTGGKLFEEFKAYPVFIRQGSASYGGSQKDGD